MPTLGTSDAIGICNLGLQVILVRDRLVPAQVLRMALNDSHHYSGGAMRDHDGFSLCCRRAGRRVAFVLWSAWTIRQKRAVPWGTRQVWRRKRGGDFASGDRRVHIQPSHRSLEPARGRIQSQTPLANTCAEIQNFTQHFAKPPRDGVDAALPNGVMLRQAYDAEGHESSERAF